MDLESNNALKKQLIRLSNKLKEYLDYHEIVVSLLCSVATAIF